MSTLGWLFVAVAFALVVAAINNSWQAIYDKIRSLGTTAPTSDDDPSTSTDNPSQPGDANPGNHDTSDPAPLAPLPPSRNA